MPLARPARVSERERRREAVRARERHFAHLSMKRKAEQKNQLLSNAPSNRNKERGRAAATKTIHKIGEQQQEQQRAATKTMVTTTLVKDQKSKIIKKKNCMKKISNIFFFKNNFCFYIFIPFLLYVK